MKLHWEAVQKLAEAHAIEDPSSSMDALRRHLEFWWCQKYNRPFKDPLLDQYTLDELLYEFLRHSYADPANDPLKRREEAAKQQDDEAWIAQQMAEIQAQSQKMVSAAATIDSAVTKMEKPPEEAKAQPDPAPAESPTLPPDISTKFD